MPQHASTLLPSTLCFDLFPLTKYYSFYQFYTIYAVSEQPLFHHSVQAENTLSSGYKLACRHGTSMTVFFFPFENQYEQDTVLSARLAMPMRRAARAGPGRQEQVSLITSVTLSPLRRGARTTPSGRTCRRIIALLPRRGSTTTIPVEIVAIRAKSWRIREHM